MATPVAARFRNAEDIDPKYFCCEAMTKQINAYAGRLMTVFPTVTFREKRACCYCGAELEATGMLLSKNVGRYKFVAVECIDIDEGFDSVGE